MVREKDIKLFGVAIAPASVCVYCLNRSGVGYTSYKLTWLALGDDHADPSRGGEQATALGRL